MKKNIFLIIVFVIHTCGPNLEFDERKILKQKVEAFQFLSTYHDQLHVMIGEEEGNKEVAFEEILSAIMKTENKELIPVKKALSIIENLDSEFENIKRLDNLVDYYQSGLSLQIEGVIRGHGYLETFPTESTLSIYDSLMRK